MKLQRTVDHFLPVGNLPEQTLAVHRVLLGLADNGYLTHTTAELAIAAGMARQTLHTHLVRLRRARLLEDLEARAEGCSTAWRRLRRVHKDPNPTLTNSPYKLHIVCNTHENKIYHPEGLRNAQPVQPAVCTHSLRSGSATATRMLERSAHVQESNMSIDQDLAALMTPGRPPVPVDLRKLPPYPGSERYTPVHVPRMPRLSGDTAGDAKLLVRAYKAACQHKYGKRPHVDGKAPFRMRTAAKALRVAGIDSPYAWAAFRLMQWTFSEKSTKPPKIDYVYSTKVVEEHSAHYASVASSYDVLHKVVLTPSHNQLLELWERRRRSAACPNPGEPGEGGNPRILPPDLYAALAGRIAGERAAMEADLYRRLAAGEWIW